MPIARKLLLIVTALAVIVTACGSGSGAPSGNAEDIAANVFAEAGVEPFGPAIKLETPSDIEYFLGSTNYPEFVDSAVVQPLISIDARILYILTLDDADQADTVMAQMETDIDPTRLICVAFSLEDVVIDSRDNVVFMVIDQNHDERDALAEAFQAVD